MADDLIDPAAPPADPAAPPAPPADPKAPPAPPASGEPPKPPATPLENPDAPPVVTPATWPADWQQKLAGDDKEALKTLSRFTDPTALFKSYEAMRAKMASGELKAPLAKDAKPEEVAAWRKANGIPEAPDKYELKLEDGLVIGEPDKPLVDEYLKVAHALNQTPEQASANVGWYLQMQRQQEEVLTENNLKARSACEEELRAEWGQEYKANLNAIGSLLDGAPEGVKATVLSAKTIDGTNALNQPNVMRWLASLSREINPVATIVGIGGATPQGLEDRKAAIETMMRENREAYNKDEKVQQEYRDIITRLERLGKAA